MKARYQVKMKHYKKGGNGCTNYGFSTKVKAVIFAAGYQAALHDCGRTDLYISVWDNGNCYQNEGDRKLLHHHTLVMDTDQLKEIAEREF